jgi:hypothetical protein
MGDSCIYTVISEASEYSGDENRRKEDYAQGGIHGRYQKYRGNTIVMYFMILEHIQLT